MKTLLETKGLIVESRGKFIVIKNNNGKAIVINTKAEGAWEVHFEGKLEELAIPQFSKSFKLTEE